MIAGMSAELRVEDMVREALAGWGIGGAVLLKGKQLELHGRGAPLVIDVELVVEQWPLLPPDLKRRKASELARRLVEAQRAAQASMASSKRASSDVAKLVGRIAAAVGILGALALGVRFFWEKKPPPAPASTRPETEGERSQRLSRVCEAMRTNIYQGAPIGPYEVGGWVIELWLAKMQAPGPRESQAIRSLIADGRVAPSADETLAQVIDGTLTLDDSASPSGFHDVKLIFGDGYARAFFDPAGRPRFLAFADRIAEGVGADLGALYGRCAHLPVHDVGAWFRGRDAGLAATALLYGVGLSAETRIIDRAVLERIGGASDLGSLRDAAMGAKLNPNALRELTAEAGGAITATPGAVTLSFPLGGPLRALRASRAVAGKLGVAGERE
jgi:hypothetical protein